MKLSQTAMARRAGVAFRTWQDYEAGKTKPGADALEGLHGLGVDLGWLLTGAGDMMRVELHSPSGQVLIPKYEVRPAAGAGGAYGDPDEPTSYLSMDATWIRRALGANPENLLLVDNGGDSMWPTIADRDPVIIDKSDRDLRQDAIYVFRTAETIHVKRIQRKVSGEIVLISDNKIYPEEVLRPHDAENLVILGRVIWCGRKL